VNEKFVEVKLDTLGYPVHKIVRVAPNEHIKLIDGVTWWTNMCGEWTGEHFEIIEGQGYSLIESNEVEYGEAANGDKWEIPVYHLYIAENGWVLVEHIDVINCNTERRYVLYVGLNVKVTAEDEDYAKYRAEMDRVKEMIDRAQAEEDRETLRRAHQLRRSILLDYIMKKGIRVLRREEQKDETYWEFVEFGDSEGRLIYTKYFQYGWDQDIVEDDDVFILKLFSDEYLFAEENNERENMEKIKKIVKRIWTRERAEELVEQAKRLVDYCIDGPECEEIHITHFLEKVYS